GCPRAFVPASRADFWERKFAATQARDSRVLRELAEVGWRVMVIWECETRRLDELLYKITPFLGSPSTFSRNKHKDA
ncbi:MAG: very short patch repair endonuclease, partial [Stellaceae bacterium]